MCSACESIFNQYESSISSLNHSGEIASEFAAIATEAGLLLLG